MSHFSVCVAIPAERLTGIRFTRDALEDIVGDIIEPYWEAVEDKKYMEFHDETEEARANYETATISAVRYPDGHVVATCTSEFRKKYCVLEEHIMAASSAPDQPPQENEETKTMVYIPKCPVKCLYSFEQYCSEYCGYVKNEAGVWGYWSNPKATWDWFQIGGRFAGKLLASASADGILPSEDAPGSSEEYLVSDGAFMGDIAWEKMKELSKAGEKRYYEALVEAFQTGDVKKVDDFAVKHDDAICSLFGDVLYKSGETYEEFRKRRGMADEDEYDLSAYAFVDKEGNWISSGDMGWWGISSNEKEASDWNEEFQSLLAQVNDDDYLVIIDCHI